MNNYIIPANSKKSQLILGFFTPFDLGLFITGLTISCFLLMVVKSEDIKVMALFASPLLISSFLVAPLPYYHNVLTLLNNIFKFFMNQREYKWKGWCVKSYANNRKDR